MKINIKNRGTSLIEVLIYVAILSIIGSILTGYFMTTIYSESEHTKNNDLSTSLQNINSTLKYDLSKAISVSDPGVSNGTSSRLLIVTSDDLYEYSLVNKILIKKAGTTTQSISAPLTEVDSVYFRRRDHYESRLMATSTSIEFVIAISNKDVKSMERKSESVFLVGKDSI
jgi:type II secretory pathway component PulJ